MLFLNKLLNCSRLRCQLNAEGSADLEQQFSEAVSLNNLSSRRGQYSHKGWWENMKPAGLWYSPFEILPAALLCRWPSERAQQRPCFCVSVREIAPAVSHFRCHSLARLRTKPSRALQFILGMPQEFDPESLELDSDCLPLLVWLDRAVDLSLH